MKQENAVMGRIGLIYNHDRSIECRIQCKQYEVNEEFPHKRIVYSLVYEGLISEDFGIVDLIKKFSYHPEVKKYKQLSKI